LRRVHRGHAPRGGSCAAGRWGMPEGCARSGSGMELAVVCAPGRAGVAFTRTGSARLPGTRHGIMWNEYLTASGRWWKAVEGAPRPKSACGECIGATRRGGQLCREVLGYAGRLRPLWRWHGAGEWPLCTRRVARAGLAREQGRRGSRARGIEPRGHEFFGARAMVGGRRGSSPVGTGAGAVPRRSRSLLQGGWFHG
jgi:hypothetical protein